MRLPSEDTIVKIVGLTIGVGGLTMLLVLVFVVLGLFQTNHRIDDLASTAEEVIDQPLVDEWIIQTRGHGQSAGVPSYEVGVDPIRLRGSFQCAEGVEDDDELLIQFSSSFRPSEPGGPNYDRPLNAPRPPAEVCGGVNAAGEPLFVEFDVEWTESLIVGFAELTAPTDYVLTFSAEAAGYTDVTTVTDRFELVPSGWPGRFPPPVDTGS